MVYYQLLQDYGCSDDEKIEKSSDLNKKITEASEAERRSVESSINGVATEFLSDNLRERAVEGDLGSCQDDAADDFENPGEETPEEQPPSFGDSDSCKSLKTTIRGIKQGESSEGLKPFNPREENRSQMLDLRHQETDEMRNAEERMLIMH